MSDQDESARLWKVNRTIHELVKDRVRPPPPPARTHLIRCAQGYQVSDDEIHMDLASFRSHYANQTGVVECVWICACLRIDGVWY